MARLFYDARARKDRFELCMNRAEAKELLLAILRWRAANEGSVLRECGEQLREFFRDESADHAKRKEMAR